MINFYHKYFFYFFYFSKFYFQNINMKIFILQKLIFEKNTKLTIF